VTFKKVRRWLGLSFLLVVATLFTVFGQAGCVWLRAWLDDKPATEAAAPGFTDDASRMNRTHVAEVWPVPADAAAAESQLRDLLNRARTEHLGVAIAGSRHSMGGHCISPDGIVVNMLPFHHMSLDTDRSLLRVGAGARWSEVIPYLDARGYSVAVMQSNNDFSVGGSLSVSCHGWQHNQPPIASTVAALRVMKADGSVVRCSRDENAELFSLVLGGYGLFGIILEAELRVVPNERYRVESEVIPCDKYVARFGERVNAAGDAGMVYGRLCVVPGDGFLREAIQTVFRKAPCPREEIPVLHTAGYASLRREIYRGQIGSNEGKEVRWKTEKTVSGHIAGKFFSRNQLLNEGAEVYREKNADRTDILHEYFVPPDQFAAFLERARTIFPRHKCDLLNVTVRNVLKDNDTFLRYADRDMFALVMLFNQPRTPQGDEQMQALSRELIDAALECGGRYYLPYRLHATPEQFQRAYPQAPAFFEHKRRYDPDELFRNQFYERYGRRQGG
jgi:FAD/FMN-containing dehydrogenase